MKIHSVILYLALRFLEIRIYVIAIYFGNTKKSKLCLSHKNFRIPDYSQIYKKFVFTF